VAVSHGALADHLAAVDDAGPLGAWLDWAARGGETHGGSAAEQTAAAEEEAETNHTPTTASKGLSAKALCDFVAALAEELADDEASYSEEATSLAGSVIREDAASDFTVFTC
jgi:hypothetical protein